MSVKRLSPFKDGSESVAQAARFRVILLTLAKHAPIYTVMCLPPAIWAGAEGIWGLCVALLVPAVLAALIYALALRHDLPSDLRGIEAQVTIALVILIGGLLCIPAFMALGMPAVDALFEAMSAVTTTGHSVSRDPDAWPFAAHFLRAWVQWCGGLVMATAVLALLLPSGLPTRRLGRAGIDEGDRIASTRRQAQQLLGVYAGLTVGMGCLAALLVPDWREGMALTLSAISTAGFAPRSDSLASYPPLAQGVVMLTCVLGSVSLLTYVLALQGKPGEAWRLGSVRRVLLMLGAMILAYLLILLVSGVRGADTLYHAVLNLVSALTTTGFSASGMPVPGAALLLLLLAMFIGGDVGSTAGGIKMARIGILYRLVAHVLLVARLPRRAVAPLRERGKPVKPQTIDGILALLCLYGAALLLIWMQCLAHGLPPMPSLFDIVSTLSTVGLSTGVVSADLPADVKLSLSFAMWLGRLEFIAVLVLLSPRVWLERK